MKTPPADQTRNRERINPSIDGKCLKAIPYPQASMQGRRHVGKNPKEKGVIRTRKKLYRLPLPYTYKETELLEDLNYGMEWVLIYYRRSLK